MARMAVVNGTTVENIIEAEDGFAIPGRLLVPADAGAAIGGTYEDGAFMWPLPLPEPTPDRVTARQFKLQLLAPIEPHYPDGIIDHVEAWIAAQDRATRIAYADSGTFVRTDPMMQAGFAALGFSPEQIDAFFAAADKL